MWSQLRGEWQACVALAWDSYCEGSVPIGAVVVDSSGLTLTRGRSQAASIPQVNGNGVSGGPLSHAELNALLGIDWAATDPRTCEIYTLLEPCPLCVGAICMAGVKHIHYAARDAWAGSTNLLAASPYLIGKSIRAYGPSDPELEVVVHMLQVAAELRRGHPRVQEVLASWATQSAQGVALGRRLHRSAELDRLCLAGLPVHDVVDRLAQLAEQWGDA